MTNSIPDELKQPKSVLIIGGIFVAIFILGAISDALGVWDSITGRLENRPSPVAEIQQFSNVPIAISATNKWQSTNILLNSGDRVLIRVVDGKWSAGIEEFPDEFRNLINEADLGKDLAGEVVMFPWELNDGSGYNSTCGERHTEPNSGCPAINFIIGSLVARAGKIKYSVGTGCVFTTSESGELELQMNDTDLTDNYGILAVEVVVEPNDDDDLPACDIQAN